jgi:hypothetical protein
LSGVLTAKRRVPSGEIASGRTCPLSKSVYGGGEASALGVAMNKVSAAEA